MFMVKDSAVEVYVAGQFFHCNLQPERLMENSGACGPVQCVSIKAYACDTTRIQPGNVIQHKAEQSNGWSDIVRSDVVRKVIAGSAKDAASTSSAHTHSLPTQGAPAAHTVMQS